MTMKPNTAVAAIVTVFLVLSAIPIGRGEPLFFKSFSKNRPNSGGGGGGNRFFWDFFGIFGSKNKSPSSYSPNSVSGSYGAPVSYNPPKPSYEPVKPSYEPVKPSYEPVKPSYGPVEPHNNQKLPTYEPVKPTYGPVEPPNNQNRPSYEPARPTDLPPGMIFDFCVSV